MNSLYGRIYRSILITISALITSAPSLSSAQTVIYYHTDALGTPIATTDQASLIIQRSELEPFGGVLNHALTDGPGFTGHISDSSTGLSYMQQRYYDPVLGRFLSTDPVSANDISGDNFNRYWYANDNPYKFVDPDGRWGTPFGLSATYVQTSSATQQRTSEAQKYTSKALYGKLREAVEKLPEVNGDATAKVHAGIVGGSLELSSEINLNETGPSTCITSSACALLGPGLYAGASASPSVSVGDMNDEDYYVGVVAEGGHIVNGSIEVNFNSSGANASAGGGTGEGAVLAAKICKVVDKSDGCSE